MRLLVTDTDPDMAKSALSGVHLENTSVLLNPQWLTPDPSETLWIACGSAAVKMVQAAGWIPKKGGVESNRGKLFPAHPDGWTVPIKVGVTYAPTVRHMDYSDFVTFLTDLNLYKRFEKTGSLSPLIGKYAWVTDLSGVIGFIHAKHALTGLPVEVCIDTETMGLHPWFPDKHLLTVSFTAEAGYSDVVDLRDLTPDQKAKFLKDLDWLVTSPMVKTVGANLKFDMLWLRVKFGIKVTNFTFDSCNAGSLCEENRSNSLNIHTKVYVPDLGGYDDHFNSSFDKSHMELAPKDDLLTYAGGDTDAGLRVFREIRKELLSDNVTATGIPSKNSLTSLYINVVHPAIKAIHHMEYHGVCVDVDRFHEFGADLQGKLIETKKQALSFLSSAVLQKHGGLEDDGGAPLSRPHLIADALFSPMGLNLKPLQVTEKTGKPSTAEYHLTQFKDHPDAGPLVQCYLAYQQVAKMHGTYYKGFLNHLRPDNRWHATYIIHKAGGRDESGPSGTVTGRGSATEPAFQCVDGSTEILTDKGVFTAAELIDGSGVTDQINFVPGEVNVWSLTEWRKTSHFFRSWRADRLRVTLACGATIICTPEHPFSVFPSTPGRSTGLIWRKAKDLKYTDTLRPTKAPPAHPAPEHATPAAMTLLGLLMGLGIPAETPPYLETPLGHADLISDGFREMGMPCHIENMEKVHAVVIPDPGTWTPSFQAFMDRLHLGSHFPRDLRGTEAAPHFIRGMHYAGRFIPKTLSMKYKVAVRYPTMEMARAVHTECLTSDIVAPHIAEHPYPYVRWGGHAARAYMRYLGLPIPIAHNLPKDPAFWTERHDTMRVVDVSAAPAGYVYDFTVPKVHHFTANGLSVHNTVPKHSYWGKRIRECIIAPPGKRILGVDYSQGELKVAACWAGEQQMLKAYRDGINLHLLTAATVNAMSYEEALFLKTANPAAYDALRQNGKAGNFGLLYGMSAYGFMMYADAVYGVKLTLEEAEAMRDAFFDLYPGLPMWHQRQINEALQFGYVRSPLGRIRHLPNIYSPMEKVQKGARNQAINSPIQGTLGDMMWWAMGIVEAEKAGAFPPFGNVHDQGLWYISEDTWEEDAKYIQGTMENLPFKKAFGWEPELKFTTDAEVGDSLAGLIKVKF